MFPAKTKSSLATAEKAAQTYSDSQPVGATTMPCPHTQKELKEVIKVKVVGEDGVGLGDIALQLSRDDKQALTGKTAPDGVYAFKGLEPGNYQLSLPELDKDAWKELQTQPLLEDEAKSSSVASWQSPPSSKMEAEKTHIIQQGECVGKIAEVYGFFPKTIWNYGKNAELKKLRHDNMYILFEKDQVVIPAKRQKTHAVAAGDALTIHRQGVPEHLHIRFLHHDETPRVGVPYVVNIKIGAGESMAAICGTTDAAGFVRATIPPRAVFADIYLGEEREQEIYEFNLGYVNPIDTLSGVKARLNNLGYDSGKETDEIDEQTIYAIKAFQRHYELEITGARDEKTLMLLEEKFGS